MSTQCPSCGMQFATGERFCPTDGVRLEHGRDLRETAPLDADPLVGRTLDGRYRIDEKLGEGGMGTVYRVTHTLMDKPLAVKVLRSILVKDEAAARRFKREAKSASRLDHDHCIRVTDFGATDEGLLFLVMEYLHGATLAEEIHARGALPAARVAKIARQVALALDHAHSLGLVHRDLKPDNIFLTTRGAETDFVKVLDFGLAKLLDGEVPEAGKRSLTLTQAGMVFGTPEYMSPEQADGRPLDGRTDLYSLGVVMYHALTGQLPFLAPSYLGILTKHLTEPPISPRDRRPDLSLPPALVAVIMRCLEKHPAARYPDARALAAALETADLAPPAPRVRRSLASHPTVDVDAQPEPGSAAGPDVDSEPAPPRSRAPLWIALGGLALLSVLGAVLLTKGSPRTEPAGTATSPAPPPSPPPPSPPPGASPETPPGNIEAPVAGAEPVTADASPPPIASPPPRSLTAGDHIRLAAQHRKKGNRIKELFELQQAVRLEPRNAGAIRQLGSALLSNGQKEAACATLRRALTDSAVAADYEAAACGLVNP